MVGAVGSSSSLLQEVRKMPVIITNPNNNLNFFMLNFSLIYKSN